MNGLKLHFTDVSNIWIKNIEKNKETGEEIYKIRKYFVNEIRNCNNGKEELRKYAAKCLGNVTRVNYETHYKNKEFFV